MDIIFLVIAYFAWKWYDGSPAIASKAESGRAPAEDPENDPISPSYVGNDYAPPHHGSEGVEHA